MHDALGPGTTLGYCTNVHAGATLGAIKSNLDRYAVAVKRRVSPESPMGIGLWLPAPAAHELIAGNGVAELRDWLADRSLVVFTLNGFPYEDFHRPVVKHDVYRPDWADAARLEYTLELIRVMVGLTSSGGEASISTLPLGWRSAMAGGDARAASARHLRRAARFMADQEDATGVLVHVDLEPEPGCALDRSEDVVSFFNEHLLGGDDDAVVRRHLRVCHDVCHAAVMFESQEEIFGRYADAGIAVGKTQLSAALRVPFGAMSIEGGREARARLAAFGEDRYLHQTTVRSETTGAVTMHDDLPLALATAPDPSADEWRVHYHVPLFLDRIGRLLTTASENIEAVARSCAAGTRHFEVETYAWDVLPKDLRTHELADGIAREIRWILETTPAGSET